MNHLKPLMDKNFLEYASYVIKDRAIPDVMDGLKPVQRRILYTLMKIDDGKFNKVANVVGESMKLHPHGDASIFSALVVLANKEYFIEKQGNFGNVFTGDPASAARYIEARLTSLAKEVLFNADLTELEDSYDGRNKEPKALPCKIPVTLLLGTDGIAVGMSTSILPHNFNEVLSAQIAYLEKRSYELLPDFITGGILDVSQYQQGNGKVKCRAKIEVTDDKTLVIKEVPYGVTTEGLIRSIQDAVNKGKLKISSINDFTAENVEIEVKSLRGINANTLLKPMYAFTDCEVSISPNLLVIRDSHPVQLTTSQVLEYNTDRLLVLLQKELEIELLRTQQKWHAKRLESLFIGNKIYKKIEECETYEAVQQMVAKGLKPFQAELQMEITAEDVERLLSIPIKRISKFDLDKCNKEMTELQKEIKRIQISLKNIVGFTIDYLKKLLDKYGKLYPRKTVLLAFEEISIKEVVAADTKVGWIKEEGYLGTAVKSDLNFLCSPYDRLVAIYTNGLYKVIRVPEKLFIGTDIHYLGKVDPNLVFNCIYYEGTSRIAYAKRFQVKGYILDKEYRLFEESNGAKIIHLSLGNNVKVKVHYFPQPRLRILEEDFVFDEIAVKGINARGNRISPKPIKKATTLVDKNQGDSAQLSLIP